MKMNGCQTYCFPFLYSETLQFWLKLICFRSENCLRYLWNSIPLNFDHISCEYQDFLRCKQFALTSHNGKTAANEWECNKTSLLCFDRLNLMCFARPNQPETISIIIEYNTDANYRLRKYFSEGSRHCYVLYTLPIHTQIRILWSRNILPEVEQWQPGSNTIQSVYVQAGFWRFVLVHRNRTAFYNHNENLIPAL